MVKENFYKHKREFEERLCSRGYPTALVHKILTEVQFSDKREALRNKTKKAKEVLPFVTTYNPATPNLKKILMKHWHIQQQPRLAHVFKQPPIVLTGRKKSLKDVLVRAKLSSIAFNHAAIIKTCKQRSTFKSFVFKPDGNLHMIFC